MYSRSDFVNSHLSSHLFLRFHSKAGTDRPEPGSGRSQHDYLPNTGVNMSPRLVRPLDIS